MDGWVDGRMGGWVDGSTGQRETVVWAAHALMSLPPACTTLGSMDSMTCRGLHAVRNRFRVLGRPGGPTRASSSHAGNQTQDRIIHDSSAYRHAHVITAATVAEAATDAVRWGPCACSLPG